MSRCSKGYRKCFSGQCVKKRKATVKKCSKGTRKCSNKKCYSKTHRYHMGSKHRRTARK